MRTRDKIFWALLAIFACMIPVTSYGMTNGNGMMALIGWAYILTAPITMSLSIPEGE